MLSDVGGSLIDIVAPGRCIEPTSQGSTSLWGRNKLTLAYTHPQATHTRTHAVLTKSKLQRYRFHCSPYFGIVIVHAFYARKASEEQANRRVECSSYMQGALHVRGSTFSPAMEEIAEYTFNHNLIFKR